MLSSSLPLYRFLSLFCSFCLCLLSGFLLPSLWALGLYLSVSGVLSLSWFVSPAQIFFLSSTLIPVCLSVSFSFNYYMDFNLTPLLLDFYPSFFEYLMLLSLYGFSSVLSLFHSLSWSSFLSFFCLYYSLFGKF